MSTTFLERPKAQERTFERLHTAELVDMAAVSQRSSVAPAWREAELARAPSIDYSPLIAFVREQGGYSCGMQAAAACWDILNEKVTPFSPNVSVNRMIWLWKWIDLDRQPVTGHDGRTYTSVLDYEMAVGVPTEGSELTNTDAVQWPTEVGNGECANFRVAGPSIPIPVNEVELKKHLAVGPIRVVIWHHHFVALVGYDDATRRFTFVNSWGDQWGDRGFGYVEYARLSQEIQGAERYTVVAPKSVPVARLSLTHTHRQSVFLWLGVEGQPAPKRIWPTGQLQDVSRGLTFTATLPAGVTWPPAPGRRVYLDIYDCGGPYESGGDLHSLQVAFGGQVLTSAQLASGVLHFPPHVMTRVYVP